MSQKVDGMLLISRGSTSNIDPAAELLSSGHSQIKVFNLNNITANGYTYDTDGMRLGWGLRNSVGVAEHPTTGGIFSVENSVDQATRDGQDVHEDNPGEEMNFHGYLNGTEYTPQGSNYGYPYCFAAWAPSDLPNNSNLTVGSQFAIGDVNNTINDTYCAEQTPPRLTFEAHVRHFPELSLSVRGCFLSCETCCRGKLPILAFYHPLYSPDMSKHSILIYNKWQC